MRIRVVGAPMVGYVGASREGAITIESGTLSVLPTPAASRAQRSVRAYGIGVRQVVARNGIARRPALWKRNVLARPYAETEAGRSGNQGARDVGAKGCKVGLKVARPVGDQAIDVIGNERDVGGRVYDHAARVDEVDGIVYVAHQIRAAPLESNWILRRPPAGLSVIIPHAEPRQLRIAVIDAAGEAKGLEARAGVIGDVPELVEVHPLHYRAIDCVDDQAWTAQMVRDDPVRGSSFHHVIGRLGLQAINEARYKVP